MRSITSCTYKLASAIFCLGGLFAVFAPSSLSHLILEPKAASAATNTVHVVMQLAGVLSVILASSLCTAGQNSTSSKSVGSGMIFAALLLLWPSRSGNLAGVFNPTCMLATSVVLALVGLMGVLMPPNQEKHAAKKKQ